MRVISGFLGGRQFVSPRGHRTHPMSEKMRGALFSSLGDLQGFSVLDAYSGSGALAIEAVSRGAKKAVAVEYDSAAIRAITDNVNSLDIKGRIEVVRSNVKGWSNNNQHQVFDIVIADPPYDDIRPDVIEKLSRHLKHEGIFVLSWPGKERPRVIKGLEIIKNSSYGDSQLVFYHKSS